MGGLLFLWSMLTLIALSFGLSVEPEAPEVTNFRNYLRIPSIVQNDGPGYELAKEWLRGQASELNLDFHILDLGPNADFALWMTWNGSDPSLKSVLFHSHLDVVPVIESNWDHSPFEAFKDSQGNIVARGASDMKVATVATLEAVRRLKQQGYQPLRNLHIMVNPDEEKGGRRAIRPFLLTPEFQQLNVGIDIDEGGMNPGDFINVRYTEKLAWHFNITARGKAGHGSTLPEYTAGQRLQHAITKVFEFRDKEFRRLQTPGVTVDDLTVVNLAQIGGGLAENIIASEAWAVFDCRIRVTAQWNWTDVEEMLNNIAEESRLGSHDDPENQVTVSYLAKNLEHGETAIDDSNIWWTVVQNSCSEMNVTCIPSVMNGATDGRFLRHVGIPVFGLGPFLNTPSTAHQDNEFVNEVEFLNGIPRYETLIRNLASTPKQAIDLA